MNAPSELFDAPTSRYRYHIKGILKNIFHKGIKLLFLKFKRQLASYSMCFTVSPYVKLFFDCLASAVFWLEFSNLEHQHGEPNQLRSIFKRALASNTDWPQYIAEQWLMFERECGTMEDVMKAEEKTKEVLKTQSQSQYQVDQNQQSKKTEETLPRSEHKSKRRRFEEEERREPFKKGLSAIYLIKSKTFYIFFSFKVNLITKEKSMKNLNPQ